MLMLEADQEDDMFEGSWKSVDKSAFRQDALVHSRWKSLVWSDWNGMNTAVMEWVSEWVASKQHIST